MGNAFSGCSSLIEFGSITTTSSVTVWTGAFQNCSSLIALPTGIDVSSASNMGNLFSGCSSLEELPALDFSAVGTYSSTAFNMLTNLKRCQVIFPDITNILPITTSAPYSLNGPALDEIFTNLPVVTGTKVINVSQCWGASSCTPSIATAKGWTVTT